MISAVGTLAKLWKREIQLKTASKTKREVELLTHVTGKMGNVIYKAEKNVTQWSLCGNIRKYQETSLYHCLEIDDSIKNIFKKGTHMYLNILINGQLLH